MSINNPTGKPTPNHQKHSEKLQSFYQKATESIIPYLSTDSLESYGFIDVQFCLLSGARAQCEVFQAVTGNIHVTEEISIQAGALYGFIESQQRNLALMEVVNNELATVIHSLGKQHQQDQKELHSLQAIIDDLQAVIDDYQSVGCGGCES